MIIDILRREHRNIERLLFVLERELDIFARGDRPDYEVVHAIIAYFQVYPDAYHHPQEDMVFEKLKARDPAAAAKIGDLTAEHRKGAKRLSQVAQAVENGLMDQGVSWQTVDGIIRDFIVHERHHMVPSLLMMERVDEILKLARARWRRRRPLVHLGVARVRQVDATFWRKLVNNFSRMHHPNPTRIFG